MSPLPGPDSAPDAKTPGPSGCDAGAGAESGLHHIVYHSQAVPPITADGLEALLTYSRAYNREVGITGLLLYADARFLQCLEGPRHEVEALFARIRKDRRHRAVTALVDAPAAARSFRHWDMACSVITSSWWLELARAEWEAHVAEGPLVPSRGFFLLRQAWREFGGRHEDSLH